MPTDKTPMEEGYPHADPPVGGQLAPGGSKWVTPHADQYVTMLNQFSRTYYWTHDEALRDSGVCNTDAMWADLVISSAIRDRQRPVVQLEWQLECRNPSDPEEKKWAQVVKEILDDIPNFQQFRRCLLDAIWWGRAGVQMVFDWDYTLTEKRLVIRKWEQIHGDTLVFKFDGTVGYLVNSQLSGKPGTHIIEGRGGYAKFLGADEDQCVLVHEFEPMASDFYRPEMAGSIKGSGYRGRVYWYWWMKHNLMRIMFDFVRKVGNGFFLAGYMAGNRTELAALNTALESQTGKPIIYVPLEQGRTLDEVLKHLPVTLQGADFQWTIISEINSLIRDGILGNSMANKSPAAGIGGSQGDHMGMTDDERVKYDAKDLETPMQKLTNTIYKHIAPHVRPAKYTHLADKRQPGEIMESANWFMQAGGAVPKPWAQEQLGIPEPNDGEEVLSLIQAQQATALQGTPAGVPQAGPGGPAPGMDGGGQGQPQQGQIDPSVASQIQPMPIQAFRDDSDIIRLQREASSIIAANSTAMKDIAAALSKVRMDRPDPQPIVVNNAVAPTPITLDIKPQEINLAPQITIEAPPPAEVKIDVQQPQPIVVPAANVVVNPEPKPLPPAPERVTTFERDAEGNMTGVTTKDVAPPPPAPPPPPPVKVTKILRDADGVMIGVETKEVPETPPAVDVGGDASTVEAS